MYPKADVFWACFKNTWIWCQLETGLFCPFIAAVFWFATEIHYFRVRWTRWTRIYAKLAWFSGSRMFLSHFFRARKTSHLSFILCYPVYANQRPKKRSFFAKKGRQIDRSFNKAATDFCLSSNLGPSHFTRINFLFNKPKSGYNGFLSATF